MLNFLGYAVVAVGLLVSFFWLGDSRPFISGDLVGCSTDVPLGDNRTERKLRKLLNMQRRSFSAQPG